ncbi:hypothetical protein FPZ12_042710 [Amycolatopsis acidicola]|uniref:Uncharacterized protein n=1 Tax=Amycolatopsis acidicola TaxID=2596893 RepID=A0A5N0UKK6_9PSEU|nr:hypothetical protein [Amycolatopsis acidicola]KAA9149721.1 hypothetical protein FPZ12_042710 [Amycolatopsis acidicola]
MPQFGLFVDALDDWARTTNRYEVLDWSVDEIPMWLCLNEKLCTLLHAQPPGPSAGFVNLIGAGARDLRPDPELFRFVATHANKYSFGALFASPGEHGVTVGVRYRVPLDVLHVDDPETYRFVWGMVEGLGEVARDLGELLVPIFGGFLTDGYSDEDVIDLFAAAMGR